MALGEGVAEGALHGRTARHDQQARGGHVQPVHDQGIGPLLLGTRSQAILLVGATSGHRQKVGRLVQDEAVRIDMDGTKWGRCGGAPAAGR